MALAIQLQQLSAGSEPEKVMKYQFIMFSILSNSWLLAPIWVIFMLSNGFTLQEVSIADIAFYSSILVFEVPTGYIADRFGRKTSIFYAYLLQAIGIFYFAFSLSLVSVIFSFIVWGIGMTMVSGALEAWIYDEFVYFHKENAESAFQSFYGKLKSLSLLVNTVAYTISGILAMYYSLKLPIILTAVLFLISGLFSLTIAEHYRSEVDSQTQEQDMIRVLTRPKLVILMSISVISTGVLISLIFWMQPFLDTAKFSYGWIGIILASGVLAGSVGSYFSKQISDRLDTRLLPVMFLLVAVSVLLMGFSSSILAVMFFVVVRFLRGVFDPFFATILNKDFSPSYRATALSLISAVSTIAIMSLEYLTASIIQYLGYEIFFIFSGSILLLVVFPLALWYRLKE